MKIPKNIKICGVNYQVKFSEKYLSENGLLGRIDYDNGIIHLTKKDVCKDVLEVTFLHELLHGMLHSMDSKMKKDEQFINALSNILYQVINQIKD